MREIKFRAWHAENGAFSYKNLSDFFKNGFHVCQGLCNVPPPYVDDDYFKSLKAFSLIAEWEQFTGLQDKNGKDIYEGDIVNDQYAHNGRILWGGYWKEAGFGKETNFPLYPNTAPVTWDRLTPELAAHLEVIGNIHEQAI
jgi:uncharacterized phage protein (TIGR01671 family)